LKKNQAMESPTDQTLQQLMFSLIDVWKSSGRTQQESCQEKELDYNKFQYWLRKYKTAHGPVKEESSRGFVRVKVKEVEKMAGCVELIYPDGRKLIFYQAVEASFLRSLMA